MEFVVVARVVVAVLVHLGRVLEGVPKGGCVEESLRVRELLRRGIESGR